MKNLFKGFGKEPTHQQNLDEARKEFPKFLAVYYSIKDGLAIEGTKEHRQLSQAVMRFYEIGEKKQPTRKTWKTETKMEFARGLVGCLIFQGVLKNVEWWETIEWIMNSSDEEIMGV